MKTLRQFLKEHFKQKEGCSTSTVRNLLNERCCMGCTLTVKVSDFMPKYYILYNEIFSQFHHGLGICFFFIIIVFFFCERRSAQKEKLCADSAPAHRERETLQHVANRR